MWLNKRVVAVIPARAGSKGIPNKNVRLIGTKPLIAYAIDNALKSKYITDVVVTTDSVMVKVIAEQMGVKTHIRSKSLCGDEVTLDGVVYDAEDLLIYNLRGERIIDVDELERGIYIIKGKKVWVE